MARLAFFMSGLAAATCLAAPAAAADGRTEAMATVFYKALAERGAFHACATLDGDPRTVEIIERSWKLDLGDSGKALTAAGFPDDEVKALLGRFDLDKATPKFADKAGLGVYCAALGDWKNRFDTLRFILPPLEIGRILNE